MRLRLIFCVSVTVPVASSSTTAADMVHPTETPQTCAQAALASSEVTAKLESDDAIASQTIPRFVLLLLTVSFSFSSHYNPLAHDSAYKPSIFSPVIEAPTVDVPLASKKANRCLMCKKRVGLTGEFLFHSFLPNLLFEAYILIGNF